MTETIRERMVDLLIGAARSSDMPAGEQMRFESMLNQMSGREPRKEPLPSPAIKAYVSGGEG